jgi:hypothetical protein
MAGGRVGTYPKQRFVRPRFIGTLNAILMPK